MSKVSIILPSLNVVKFIGQTMESVISQTLSDIEIICVDAGSTDGTWELLEEYAQKDNRIRLLHSEEKSYGYQMNLGITQATGEYIGIVETDDYILPNMYESLYRAAIDYDADVVKSDFDLFTVDEEGKELVVNYSLKKWNRVEYNQLYSCEAYMNRTFKIECYIWNAIYRRRYLLQQGIRFQESPGAAYQDFSFKFQVGFTAKRIVALNRAFYRYRRNNDNSSSYNINALQYNLAESQYVLDIFEKWGMRSSKAYKVLAQEIVEYAFGPYVEMLTWKNLKVSSMEALVGYQKMMTDFLKERLLSKCYLGNENWINVKLLAKDAKLYDDYAHVLSAIQAKEIEDFLDMAKQYPHVIVVGSGIRGKAVAAMLKNNRVKNISFLDNAKEKWNTMEMNIPIQSPQNVIDTNENALFVISSLRYYEEMYEQLILNGVKAEQICGYDFSDHPIFCTNRFVNT